MNSPGRRRPAALAAGFLFTILTATLLTACTAEESTVPSLGLGLVPVPTDVSLDGGEGFVLTADSTIALVTPEYLAPDVHHVGEELAEYLEAATL